MYKAINVRPAHAADAVAIEKLYRELVNNPAVHVSPTRIEQVTLDVNTVLLVAEYNGAVVGTALLSLCLDVMFDYQPFGIVENIVVSNNRRSSGIGAALLQEIENIARKSQCSKLMLLSSTARVEAHGFFARLGYQDNSKRGFVKYRSDFGAVPSIPES